MPKGSESLRHLRVVRCFAQSQAMADLKAPNGAVPSTLFECTSAALEVPGSVNPPQNSR